MKKLAIILFSFGFVAWGTAQTKEEVKTQDKVVLQKEQVKPVTVTTNPNAKLQVKVPSKAIATKEQMKAKELQYKMAAKNGEVKKEEVVLEEKKQATNPTLTTTPATK